ncbi:MAG: sugar ABC transporter ATP-binding protein [Aestuariivirga sp.]
MISSTDKIVATTSGPFLSLDKIYKSYPGVTALSNFSMDVRPGEIVGLVGENGAGKSTLMKILGGVIAPNRGDITIDGVARQSLTVAESMAAGIAFVHQELNLFDNLDVAANVYIGREPRFGGLLNFVDEAKLHKMVEPVLRRVGANFPSSTPVEKLSLAQHQLVEIAKALSTNARLVIFDEPTSSLPHSESDKLLDVILGLKADGISVIFISHRLHEIEKVADRVVVLRDGALVGELEKGAVNHDKMVRMMIGRDLKVQPSSTVSQIGDVVLSAVGVQTEAYPSKPVTLSLRSGEILGLAGLVGSGRTELARAMFGVDPIYGGHFEYKGERFVPTHPSQSIARGIFLVPEDRKAAGLFIDMPIVENISMPNLMQHAVGYFVNHSSEMAVAEVQSKNLGIKAPNVMTVAGALSGGNQQKVVLAKWLALAPVAMIFDEPTRGIDIGAKSEVYRIMRDLANNGVAVLMISSDMEEVIGISDRIAVMHEGQISGILSRSEFNEENVLMLAVGKKIKKGENP